MMYHPECLVCNKNYISKRKKNEKPYSKCDSYSKAKQPMETNPDTIQMLILANEEFKAAIINIFKDLKENELTVGES